MGQFLSLLCALVAFGIWGVPVAAAVGGFGGALLALAIGVAGYYIGGFLLGFFAGLIVYGTQKK